MAWSKEYGKVIVEEEEGIFLLKDTENSRYVYWVAGNGVIGERILNYTEAMKVFSAAVAAALPHENGDCPQCGGATVNVTLGFDSRSVNRCDRCGWTDDDGVDQATINAALEKVRPAGFDTYPHHDGRVGTKEYLQMNEEGFDPRSD